MDDQKLIQKIGEDLAVAQLCAEGYTILDRNYKSQFCELDIICKDDEYLYFIDVVVKSDAITEKKVTVSKKLLMKEALDYIVTNDIDLGTPYKFKKVAIDIKEKEIRFNIPYDKTGRSE